MKEHDATETAYRNGYADGKPKWISVKERLPENDGRYLCVLPIGKSGAVYVKIMNGDRHGFSLAHIYNDDVTHWMPLPSTEGLE